mmetsp:Transcript_11050/g.17965  ORF Transcript_11050/g.17965 Transcript_11050/m.17965 type:complete len:229 (+) Transcript_11050:286-972(+)
MSPFSRQTAKVRVMIPLAKVLAMNLTAKAQATSLFSHQEVKARLLILAKVPGMILSLVVKELVLNLSRLVAKGRAMTLAREQAMILLAKGLSTILTGRAPFMNPRVKALCTKQVAKTLLTTQQAKVQAMIPLEKARFTTQPVRGQSTSLPERELCMRQAGKELYMTPPARGLFMNQPAKAPCMNLQVKVLYMEARVLCTTLPAKAHLMTQWVSKSHLILAARAHRMTH